MRQRNTILAAATAILMITGATAATAAGTGTGADTGAAGKKPAQCVPAKPKPDPKLENALRDVKTELGKNGGKLTDKVVAIFAKDMGISTAEARQFLQKIFRDGVPTPAKPTVHIAKKGKGGSGDKTGPASVFTAADLAKALGVSTAKAKTALDALQKMATGPRGTVDEKSPAFAAVAAGLGVTPQKLTKAMYELKMAAAEPVPGKSGDGKPCKKPGKPGKPGDTTPGWTAADLAKVLGVSQAKAKVAMDSLNKLAKAGNGHIEVNSPAYAAIAAKLGVTPQQLTNAIIQLKTANSGKPGDGKSGKPGGGKI